MYFPEKRVLYLHVGRSGGHAVECKLWEIFRPDEARVRWPESRPDLLFGPRKGTGVPMQHFDVDLAEDALGLETLRGARCFASVRNPWERLYSIFTYPGVAPGAFADFVREVAAWHRAGRPRRGYGVRNVHWFMSQRRFVEGARFDRVDVIRTESLEADLGSWLARHDLIERPEDFALKQTNSFRRDDGSEPWSLYTPELIELVREVFADEIEYFGFEPSAGAGSRRLRGGERGAAP